LQLGLPCEIECRYSFQCQMDDVVFVFKKTATLDK
jgi:hypothetical protein